jgi:cellulose synthase/poly-beta-1,6-N-acetylglucosamine synthase-like glycosyltransferase
MKTMEKKYLVDLQTPRQKRQLHGLLWIWAASAVLFYVWWFNPVHVSGFWRFFFNTLVISWPILMPAYAFHFVRRMKKPNPALGIPEEWRVAYIVTKAPSEPWDVARRSLEGMLADNEIPHATWIADEDPSEETLAWCRDHGVKVSCRKGVKEYHNLTFPRRTRCKEGNLAYFYDHWGYRDYDFVAQMDADHMPLPGYLKAILLGFHDPKIGYVSAPSICEYNAKDSWVARGRLYTEAVMHGAMQAGAHGDFVSMCIGSHFAVRTKALQEIGGLGPELAEDHSTTFLFNAHGWRGVHSIDAVASGFGPATFKDGMVQELQWTRSLAIIFLTLTPKHIHKFPWRLGVQFLFAQFWYFLFSFSMLGAFFISPIAILTGQSFSNVSLPVFLIASLIPTAISVGVCAWLKRHGLLRPADAPVLSWESVLFPIMRWPLVTWGVLKAFQLLWIERKQVWKVTPKNKGGEADLPLKLFIPYGILISFSLAVTFFTRPTASTFWYSIFNKMNAFTYLLLIVVVIYLNKKEKQQTQTANNR